MRSLKFILLATVTILLVSACNQQPSEIIESQYQEVGWDDLIPEDEKKINENSRVGSLEIFDDYNDGNLSTQMQAYSSGVVSEMNGASIRVPGFIVPLEFDAGNEVTEFFLVPYFGACFHMPPPPPNQTIYVSSETPVEFESIYDPVWIKGVIKTKHTGNEVANAAYSMDLDLLEVYVD